MAGEGERQVSTEALEQPMHVVTPLLKSKRLSDQVGFSTWLKLENVQTSGSFKVRGLGLFCQKVSCYVFCISVKSTHTAREETAH